MRRSDRGRCAGKDKFGEEVIERFVSSQWV